MLKSLLLILLLFANTMLAADNKPPTLLIVGDSLSAAYGINQDRSWVALLNERLQTEQLDYWQVVNASISGETTDGGLRRLPDLLERHQPQLIVIELGGNDGLRGYPPEHIYQNLQTMIELSLEHAEVLLVGIELPPNYGPRYTRAFADIFSDLSIQYQVELLPFFLQDVYDAAAMMQADGLHPTEAAQPQLLENIWPYLEPLLVQASAGVER